MYFFSPSTNCFYPGVLRLVYESAEAWPADAVAVSYELYAEFSQNPPIGKQRIAGPDGAPMWSESPLDELSVPSLLAAVTSQRWEVETSGLTLPTGVRVATRIDDQNRITSVVANAERSGLDQFDFKAESGWVRVALAELQGIASAIALHVQACFSAERMHHEAIDALAEQFKADPHALQAALRAYDEKQGWPATDLRELQPT